MADVLVGTPPELSWVVDRDMRTRGGVAIGDVLIVGGLGDSRESEVAEACCHPAWICYEVSGGTVRWRANASMQEPVAVGPFAVAANRCVAGVRDEGVVARGVSDGDLIWRTQLDDDVDDLVVAGDEVLVGASFGEVRALGLDDGREHWHTDVGMTPETIVAVDGAAFIASQGGAVAALR